MVASTGQRTVWQIDPKHTEAYCVRAAAHCGMGQLDSGLADYKKALEIDPKSGAYTGCAFVHIQLRDYDLAINECDRALELDPKQFLGYATRGTAYVFKGQFSKALADLDRAIEIAPQWAPGYSGRGFLYLRKGDLTRAITDCTKAIQLDPSSPDAYNYRAQALLPEGKYGLVLGDLDQALKLTPEDPALSARLALILAAAPDAKLRDAKRAVALATKACELTNWKNSMCLGTLAAAHAESGQFEEALKWAKRGLELAPDEEKQNFRLAIELFQAKRPYRLSRSTETRG